MSIDRPQLSARQEKIVEFIRRSVQDHGYPPTVREIGRAVGITSTSVVDYNLNILEHVGLVRRDREISRGIELIGDAAAARPASVVRVPVVGLIAAGEPIEALSELVDAIDLPKELASTGAYALRVKGKSMIEDLIDDGDLVVVQPQSTADNGQIVVALLSRDSSAEGVVTLKRLYRERDRVRLQPANSEMSPIYALPEEVQIQGTVTTVIRQIT